MFIVKDNALLLAKLQRDITCITLINASELGAMRLDTLAVIAYCECTFPVKFGVFIPDRGLEDIYYSDPTIFMEQIAEEGGNLMNPVILTITVVTEYH